ncbi:hypothetical protein [Cetacean poxvirus 1]|nr:hypothetical protein [Cetacean poxvirus 1]
MNAVYIFFIIIATAIICLLLLQAYIIYDNFDSIKEFNKMHAGLEFSKSVGGTSIDHRVTDYNDDIYDVKQKWRCVKYKDYYYVSLSIFGFRSNKDKSIMSFQNIDECIYNNSTIFTDFNIYNPCLEPNGNNKAECIFLKSVL